MEMKRKIDNSAKWYYNLALEKANNRDLSGAIHNLKTALFFDRKFVDARNLLGLIYFEMGQITLGLSQWVLSSNVQKKDNLAIEYLKKTQDSPLELDKLNQVIKKYNQALVYAKQGDEDLSLLQLKKVISLMPNFIDAHLLMALLYFNADRKDEALERVQDVLKQDTKNATALAYMQELKAQEVAPKVVATQGETVEAAKSEKKAKREKKEKEDKVSFLDRFKNQKRSPSFYTVAGLIIGIVVSVALILPTVRASSSSEYRSQIKDYKEQIIAKDTQLKSNENEIKEAKAAQKKAEDEVKEYVGDSENEGIYDKLLTAMEAYANRSYTDAAEALLDIDRDKLSSKKMKSIYDDIETNTFTQAATGLYNKAYSYYSQGDYKNAIKTFKKAIKVKDTNVASYYYLARSYEENNDKKNAIKFYKQVVEKFPSTNSARNSQTRIDSLQGTTAKSLD